ncbi:MAG: molybdopterin molybdenumtransferase MoeA [Betaproteobacteria bacterium]|nr:molybdopterin molybdenumtransferase MoeA [Betaproteobacteria bacterium]NCP81557.1 molybdopterin molybdenumtransferase MoeA [Rhodoferax sp.]NCS61778.1 molybdopterin molybdenumtransferase MoeA [Rhodoferax sp.]
MKTLEQIASELAGYDPQALSASLVGSFLNQLVEPVTEAEDVGIFAALGRVLALDVISPISVPPHDNSAMDGYAFDGAQLSPGAALTLNVVGTALAGKGWVGTVQAGQCVRIMTGAIMPTGLNTVVPQELASVQGEQVTIPPNILKPGDNRRFKGEDLLQGHPALQKGELLTPAALGLVASLGIKTVPVLRRLKVAYFSTGDEILSLGEPPREGAVYDSNRYTVFGLLTRLGCEVMDLGVVRDQPEALEAAFVQAALQADAIITSGGVSVGEADYTKAMMKKLGDVAFWKIAMRPGRPMAVGHISRDKLASSPYYSSAYSSYKDSNSSTEEGLSPGTQADAARAHNDAPAAARRSTGQAVLFGLPGNPVAVMVTFLAFVRPALLRMMGSTASAPPLLKAHSVEAIRKKPGRTEYQRGVVSTAADGTLQVKTTGNQGSGVLSSMVQANGLIVLHHAQGNVAVDEAVDVMLFDGVI